MFSASDLAVIADHTDGGRVVHDMVQAFGEDVRVRIGGFISRVLHHHHTLMPAVGFSTAQAVDLAASDAREDLLAGLMQNHPDKEWAAEFSKDRCVVPLKDRPGKYVVETRIPGLTNMPLTEYDTELPDVEYTVFTDSKVYSLDQFFSDMDVIEKFPLTEQFLQTVRRCAVTKPNAAAQMLQNSLRARGYTGVSIKVGKFVKSKKRAAEVIKESAKRLVDRDFGVWSKTIDQKIFYYHDDLNSVVQWSVEGPLRYAYEVKCVYDLCLSVGIQEAMQMLALETAVIGIEIYDAMADSYVTGIVEGHVSLAGIEPTGDRTVTGLSPEEATKFFSLGDRVLPVTVDGKVVASAVRVTDRYSLVCNHVVAEVPDDAQLLIAGVDVVQHKIVGNDLWVVSSAGSMRDTWVLRDAYVGERVVFVYSVGDELEVSTPVTVFNVDGCDVALGSPPQLRKGMSGAAVVAVSDGALLGVYRGKTGDRALATVFGAVKYGELTEIELISQASVSEHHNADDVALHFSRKGYYAAYKSAASALVPLHSSTRHLGFGVCYGKTVVTPLDPDVYPLRVGSSKGRSPEFAATDDGRFFSDMSEFEAHSVHAQTRPSVGMRVVICGRDADGIYLSEVCMINQLGVGAKRFYIDPPEHAPTMPLVGGVVLSYDNATVVGQYVGKTSDSLSVRGVCYSSFERPKALALEVQESATTWLAKKFPMLSPVAWEYGGLDRMLSHPKGGPLLDARAMIGDSVMKVVACKGLERVGARVSTWTSTISSWQKNSVLIKIAERHGLHGMFRIDPGMHIPAESKKYADLIEGLVGMAFLHEEWSVVEEFCFALGVVPRDVEGSTPTVSGFPRLNFGSVEDNWISNASTVSPEGSVVVVT